MAELSVVLLEEPIAALLAYRLEIKEGSSGERNMVVFDFGGGSLDVSVVTIQEKELKVKATLGDTDLGGEYFDDRLAKYCQQELILDAYENPEALRRLRAVAERAKLILSSADQKSSLHDEVGWEDSFILVMVERMNRYQFEPCIELVAECLTDAGVEREKIEDVIIVGGLSNIPRVQELLRNYFEGKQLHKSVKLNEAIVRGAAIKAAMLSGEYFEKKGKEMELEEHANKNVYEGPSLKKNTGRYKCSNWIWMCSLAAIATVSFLFAPRACHLLQKQDRPKQWYGYFLLFIKLFMFIT